MVSLLALIPIGHIKDLNGLLLAKGEKFPSAWHWGHQVLGDPLVPRCVIEEVDALLHEIGPITGRVHNGMVNVRNDRKRLL